ncbi:RNA polymerase II-associated [Myxozyma melibiosi]|uniref:RNA polymerase II-associated n=1 Tax=Myxozyma melibiosi TaxID=54550 RepID=A0ABR1F3L7_9ASCO
MSRAVRQDYIARIRYQNNLPPPPCPPKLLDVTIPLSDFTSSGFLSALVQQQPLNVDIDAELGMPLDMTVISGVFDKGDESNMYPDRSPAPMNETDRLLLRDPGSISGVSKSQPGVSFLRRTEYISTDAIKQARQANRAANTSKAVDISDPRKQLQTIEDTFKLADEELSTFQHPTKKGLVVEESWALVPDVEVLDLTYLLMKMAGAAPGVKGKDETGDSRYDVAVARPTGTEDNTFMSVFLAEQEAAEKFKHKISISEEEAAAEEAADDDENTVYRFTHTRDYDITSKPTDTITLGLDSEQQKAYFHPVAMDLTLKRRRQFADASKRKKVPDVVNEVAAVEIQFRELTAEEKAERDSLRRQEFGYIPPE